MLRIISLFLLPLTVDSNRLPIASSLFEHYSSIWLEDHKLWKRYPWADYLPCSSLILPICLNGSIVNDPLTSCSPQCNLDSCSITSADTFDFIPNLGSSLKCSNFINSSQFDAITFMSEGISPYFSTIPEIGLHVRGKLSVKLSTSCQSMPNARFQIHHVDTGLMESEEIPNENNRGPSSIMYNLRKISCSLDVTTDDSGSFSFYTSLPPSYGPPRHITFVVDIDGYSPLITRMYFNHDSRLYQLVTSSAIEVFPASFNLDHVQRVADWDLVGLYSKNSMNESSLFTGYVDASFDLVLSPVRDKMEVVNSSNLIGIEGAWFDNYGKSILIETFGSLFTAIEIPHVRTWGAIMGLISGNTIFGADFRHGFSLSAVSNLPPRLEDMGLISMTKGFIQRDSGTFIHWSSDQGDFIWTKSLDHTVYRFLKLSIQSSFGTSDSFLEINEAIFYQGILGQIQILRNTTYMLSGRYPPPQLVSCSSFTAQDHHCYKAFDGVTSSKSSWRTHQIGPNSDPAARGSPQWLIIDFGAGRSFYPTAIEIICGLSTASLSGCPMSFKLLASMDLITFDILFYKEFVPPTDFKNNSLYYSLFSESPHGRPNGQPCGSCERPPYYTCRIESFDASCASAFCGDKVCSPTPPCPSGFYRSTTSLSTYVSTQCLPCPLGSFGMMAGLTSPLCSGLCTAGYYCGLGSTSSTQSMCGDTSVYCPEGSGQPVKIPAGWIGVLANHTESAIVDGLRLYATSSITKSPLGSYSTDGVIIPCPPGRYGNTEGLQTSFCTSLCVPGSYCPSGSIQPYPCPIGSYCPDGIEHIPCPPGHFGNTSNLTDRQCSGLCSPGYYCIEGSTSSYASPCPGGFYGDQTGQVDANCSGFCPAGYFCPAGSSFATERPCNVPNYFCPAGSEHPVQVSKGFYSVGFGNEVFEAELLRVDQMICDPGYYCVLGQRYPCPAGTFGNSSGISSPDSLFYLCSGVCPSGSYCPQGSIVPTPCPAGTYGEVEGLTDSSCSGTCFLGHYCPIGTSIPFPCAGGIFGNCTGATDPSCRGGDGCYSQAGFPVVQNLLAQTNFNYNLCSEGYYCPEGSISSHQYECGAFDLFCPPGSAAPTQVSVGFYSFTTQTGSPRASSGMIQSAQAECEIGFFCLAGIKSPCPPGTIGSSIGLSSTSCSALCPLGHFCLSGSAALTVSGVVVAYLNDRIQRCPGGTYGALEGLSLSSCSGQCEAGYFCPPGSISSRQNICGGSDLYCPPRSPLSIPVSLGYYSYSSLNDSKRATDEFPCSPGHYCFNGTSYPCPAGSYGKTFMLFTPSCSGLCAKGFYCPAGSSSAMQFPCPAGTYGAENGLTNATCSGFCLNPLQCPTGTIFKPQP